MNIFDTYNDDEIFITESDDFFICPAGELSIRKRRLPHWNMPEAVYNVTFRLADSIPQFRLEQLKKDRIAWQKTYGNQQLCKELIKEYYRLFHRRVDEWLDAGYGSCILRYQNLRRFLSEAFAYYDGQRYRLGAWCIMPNHVHVLLRLLNDFTLSEVMHNWKSYSAHQINKALQKKGQIWQHESYDHIVRNKESLRQIERYILNNPVKAKLKLGEYEICSEKKVWSKRKSEDQK